MGRKDNLLFDDGLGFIKCLARLNQRTQQFKPGKQGMPFIEVVQININIQSLKHSNTTDAQEHFLSNTHIVVPTVQSLAEPTVFFMDWFHQIQWNVAKTGNFIGSHSHVFPTNLHGKLNPSRFQGISWGIWIGIHWFSRLIQRLTRVPFTPKDTHSKKWFVQILGCFDDVTGQDA